MTQRTAESIPTYSYQVGAGVRFEAQACLNGEVKLTMGTGDPDEDLAVFLSATEFAEMVDVMKGNRILREVLGKEMREEDRETGKQR